MRNDDSLQRRFARIDQIDKARSHWKSQEFKASLLQASQGLRVCWYSEQQRTTIDVSRKDSILARDVNSSASDISTSTRTMASASASADRDRCPLSLALKTITEAVWGNNKSQAKRALNRRGNNSVEQPPVISPSSPLTVDIPDRSIAGNINTVQSHLGMLA